MIVSDIEPIYRKINSEKKHVYILGDFNIDLLKTDMHRPIHDYVECIYSNSMLPSVYKPTRITANTATCVDNIFQYNSNYDISKWYKWLYAILSTNLRFFINPKKHENKFIYNRNHSVDNINFRKDYQR